MKQRVYACYALSDAEKQQLLEAYRHEQITLLTETAEGKLLLRDFAGALLERTSALSAAQLAALRSSLRSGTEQPDAFKALLDEMMKDLPEEKKPEKPAAEPKAKASEKRKTAPVVKLAPAAKPEPAKAAASEKEKAKPAAEKTESAAAKPESPKHVVWSWQPPSPEEAALPAEVPKAPEKKAKPAPEPDPLLQKRMNIALENCRKIAILPIPLTKPPKSSRLLSRGRSGGVNGIAYIDRTGRLSCLNAMPEYEEALGIWDKLKGLRVMEAEGVLIGERKDETLNVLAAGRAHSADLKVVGQAYFFPKQEASEMAFLSPENPAFVQCCEQFKTLPADRPWLDFAVCRNFYLILFADGTVLIGGNGKSRYLRPEVPIRAIAAGDRIGVMLDAAGRVHQINAADTPIRALPWSRIIAVQVAGDLIVGLQSGGTLALNRAQYAEQLRKWTNLAAVTLRYADGLKGPQILAVNNDGAVLCSDSIGIQGRILNAGITPIP
ncbi:MAG: hypothetical protein IJ060_12975 [Oscillospiraceae bacterium]|nr:hypothetical protein [Oscillospiraceae bacterium]